MPASEKLAQKPIQNYQYILKEDASNYGASSFLIVTMCIRLFKKTLHYVLLFVKLISNNIKFILL